MRRKEQPPESKKAKKEKNSILAFKKPCRPIRTTARKLRWDDINRTIGLKLHNAVTHRKKRVVAADTNITARTKFCSALTQDDITRFDLLAAVNFYAKPFRV